MFTADEIRLGLGARLVIALLLSTLSIAILSAFISGPLYLVAMLIGLQFEESSGLLLEIFHSVIPYLFYPFPIFPVYFLFFLLHSSRTIMLSAIPLSFLGIFSLPFLMAIISVLLKMSEGSIWNYILLTFLSLLLVTVPIVAHSAILLFANCGLNRLFSGGRRFPNWM